jgi:dolichol kinase
MKSIQNSSNSQITFVSELIRKATHMGALVIPLFYYVLKIEKSQMLMIMIPISVLMFIIDISRLRNWYFWRKIASKILSPIIRPHEIDGDFTGASYILLTFCLTIALFSKPIAVAAICFIIVGDSFAAVIGRKFGKHRFYKNKTIEGSLSCLVGMLIVAYLVPDINLSILIAGAFVATIFEAYSFGIDDNVTVPLLSGLFMTLLEKILLFLKII